MNSISLNYVKKVALFLVIIIMCTSQSSYAISFSSFKNGSTSKKTTSIYTNEKKNTQTKKQNNQSTVTVSTDKKATTLNTSNDALTTVSLVGADRYATTILVSKKVYPNGAENVILVNATSSTDGILAATLADKLSAPILLTPKNKLNSQIQTEIKRLSPKKVYLIGGTSAVSNSVEKAVKNMSISTERIYGNNRYKTAIAIAEKVSNFDKIIICNSKDSGKNAAAIAAIGAENGIPILYNDSKTSINKDTFNFINKHNGKIKTIYMIGNGLSTSQRDTLNKAGVSIVEISGKNPYEINIKMINQFSAKYNNAVLVNNPIDAMSISYLATKNKSLFLYTNTNLTNEQKNIFKSNEIKTIYYAGGDEVEETVKQATNLQKSSASGWTLNSDKTGVTYALYTPPNVEKYENVPVIVWLHGQENPTKSDEAFMSYLKTDVFGGTDNMPNVLDGEVVYVVAPHFAGAWRKNDCWCDTKNNVNIIKNMMENFLAEHENVDANNIVIAGHSMGAQGALFFAEYLNYFSKVALLSGYVPKCGKNLSEYKLKIPVICYIGEDDDPVAKTHTESILKKFNITKAFSFTGSSHSLISRMAFSDDTGTHVRKRSEMGVVI